ncbi:unnamed protein product [Lactuca virosa]|uniref:Uncharacterized protein n=1 Tax=Lactuca virosa TaxID=75947 RepID=A0AAU9NES0_9ASTR|nr:unnamed protein product [Lactuca virosa]
MNVNLIRYSHRMNEVHDDQWPEGWMNVCGIDMNNPQWFPEVCILREGYSLGIQGKIASEMLSQKTTYVAYLVFRTTRDTRGLAVPAKTKVSFGGIEIESENVYLRRPQFQQENYVFPCLRNDGWMEMKLGEFECNEGDDGEVEMAFEEVTQRNWKSGLIVEGIELRPK